MERKRDQEAIGSSSLAFYRKDYHPPLSIRYSLRNLRKEEGLINIPLFLVDHTSKLIELSLP